VLQHSGSREDAEDVFQEAILVLLHRVRQPDFKLTSSMKTYLYAIARNIWLKRLRDQKIRPVAYEIHPSVISVEMTGDEPEGEQSNAEKVEGWLLKITRNCQAILKALFFYEVPMNQLMLKMGWKNKHTASNQKHKCIQQVKKVKEKEG
jgi:RNA polymerase sigma factor (sigma-70 family)